MGDAVEEGDVLGVFYSDAVGSQKSAFFDAQSQLTLDEATYDQALAARSTTKTFVQTAKHAVEGTSTHINQAKIAPRLGHPQGGCRCRHRRGQGGAANDDTRIAAEKEKLEEWGRVELKADKAGVIVERTSRRRSSFRTRRSAYGRSPR